MERSAVTGMGRLGRGGLPSRLAVLLVAFGTLWLLMAPVAWGLHGAVGLWAASLATLVCLVAGWLSLVVVQQIRPAQHALAHLLAGMAIRTGLPLLICWLVVRQGGGLRDAGFAWYLLVAFMVGLSLETAMAVGQLKSLQASQ